MKKPRIPAGTKLKKLALKHRIGICGKKNMMSSVSRWHDEVQRKTNLQRIKARSNP